MTQVVMIQVVIILRTGGSDVTLVSSVDGEATGVR